MFKWNYIPAAGSRLLVLKNSDKLKAGSLAIVKEVSDVESKDACFKDQYNTYWSLSRIYGNPLATGYDETDRHFKIVRPLLII